MKTPTDNPGPNTAPLAALHTEPEARSGTARPDDVAVIAIGAMFPGRGDTSGFWRDIIAGVDTFTSVPATHWRKDDYYNADPAVADRTYGHRGGFLAPVAFDPLNFGIPPTSLSSTDTAQLLALVVAEQVLAAVEHGRPGGIDKTRTSVILGVASTTELAGHMTGRLQRPAWESGLRSAGLAEDEVERIVGLISAYFTPWKESTFPGLLGNVVAGRIANRFDLGGCNYVTDAACASSLSALQGALHELRSNDSDMVITGGVDALNDILMYMCFAKTPALSPTGDCRPLSVDADGTMLGEGLGMLALRRLDDAERDGDRIHAVIRGLGGGSDGRATAIYAPLPSGQARTLQRAYARAGYAPDTVELVEAHGTGTVAGDRAELEGLHSVFGRDPQRARRCALGSIKSQIGHTKAAAGSASLIKVIGALSRKILPPTIKISQPAAALDEHSPFYLNTVARPWIRGSDHPRRASVSSFGFGGSNFHVTLEEYQGTGAVQPVRLIGAELALFSADSTAALVERLQQARAAVAHEDDLPRAASDSQTGFDRKADHRAAIVAATPEQFHQRVDALVERLQSGTSSARPAGRGLHYRCGTPEVGKIALLCAGQGSHYLGMGAQLAMDFAAAREVWNRACDNPAVADLCLHDLAFPPAAFSAGDTESDLARLTQTQHAQPAIAAVTLAQLALLRQIGLEADLCGGHSFGEVMALHHAGVFDEATTLKLAAERGRLIQRAARESTGGMLAVLADADTVRELVAELPAGLLIANDNSPGQVVLSGDTDLIRQAGQLCDRRGLVATPLPVDTAFHTPRLKSASTGFAQSLKGVPWHSARMPVYANGTATAYPDAARSARKLLAGQISTPVRFREMVEAMHGAGARTFLEVGPGSTLSNLVRATLDPEGLTVLSLDQGGDNGTAGFLSAIGQLAVSGVDIDVSALFEAMPAPAERPERPSFAVDILGANYGKPVLPPVPAHPPSGSAGGPPGDTAADTTADKPADTAADTAADRAADRAIPSDAEAASVLPTVANGQASAKPADLSAQRSHPTMPGTAPVTATVPNNAIMTPVSAPRDHTATTPRASGGTERLQLLREVSARHSDYLNSVSDAHRGYLQLATHLLAGSGATPSAGAPHAASEHWSEDLPEAYPEQMRQTIWQPQTALNGAHAAGSATPHPQTINGSGASHKPAESPVSAAPAAAPVAPAVAPPVAPPAAPPVAAPAAPPNTPAVAPPDPSPGLPPVASPGGTASPASDRSPAAASANGAGVTDDAVPSLSADLIRGLVAEKTGYPPEMIEDDMDLGGELGIDSIKQVEILSALRDRVPELPQVEPGQLARLRSIGKIVSFFDQGATGD